MRGTAMSRSPDIMADAAWHILTQPSNAQTGCFLLDEQVLRGVGVTDFSGYSVTQGTEPEIDLFVEP
jgi:citronellol/citronellal dehydrogenase